MVAWSVFGEFFGGGPSFVGHGLLSRVIVAGISVCSSGRLRFHADGGVALALADADRDEDAATVADVSDGDAGVGAGSFRGRCFT